MLTCYAYIHTVLYLDIDMIIVTVIHYIDTRLAYYKMVGCDYRYV